MSMPQHRCCSSSSYWSTAFTKLFRVQLPIVGAPMAGYSGGLLAFEVCRAGGLGLIAAGHFASDDDSLLHEQIELFRRHVAAASAENKEYNYPLGLGFIGHSSFSTDDHWQRFESLLATYRPAVVQFFAPAIVVKETNEGEANNSTTNVSLAQRYGALVLAQVGTAHEAQVAIEASVDGLIVQGSEAGGHGVRRGLGSGTLSLANSVLQQQGREGNRRSDDDNDNMPLPVLAAGGIMNGRALAAALALGCDGAVVGTRLCASVESLGSDRGRLALQRAQSCDDVVRTTCFDWIQNTYTDHPWPEPFDSVGALRNDTTAQWQGKSDDLAKLLQQEGDNSAYVQEHRKNRDDPNIGPVLAGEGVGCIDSIEPAYDIVTKMSQDAMNIIDTAPARLLVGSTAKEDTDK